METEPGAVLDNAEGSKTAAGLSLDLAFLLDFEGVAIVGLLLEELS